MCGLLAVIERRGAVDRDRLAAALGALAHRGPDATAMAIVAGAGPPIGFGHARLAILDPVSRSDQPFRLADDRLVYNGEIYNFRDVSAGLPLTTAGDTEVLLRLLMREGTAALAGLNGMWAFVWHDARTGRIVAARDRYGKKPLFYSVAPARIAFASTIGALALLAGERPCVSGTAVERYLAEGWLFPDPSGATHVDGVREVRPGHALTLDLAGWTLTEAPVTPVDTGDPAAPPAEDALPDLIADAVRLRLIADRQVGLMLSGGIDSSLILSILAARGGLEGVITATGDDGKSDDAREAQASLAAVGARAITVPLDYGAAARDDFISVCRHQEKPFPLIGNVLGMPALYRAMAGAGVRVALDGSGADEIFGGYWYRYAGFARREAVRAQDAVWLDGIAAGGMLPPAFAGDPAAVLPEPEPTEGAHALLMPDLAQRLTTIAPRDPLARDPGTLHRALVLDATAGRMQEWLWQNDRNAMMHGIENRCPFLDPRLSRWLATPYATKFDGARNKPVLREAFRHFTPLAAAGRLPKQGFRFRYTRFIRQNAPALLDMVLSGAGTRRLLSPAGADQLLAAPTETLLSPIGQRLVVLAGLAEAGVVRLP